VSTAWLTGATGAWGGAFARALLEGGHDVLALGRRDVPELAARAAELGRAWGFLPLDLSSTVDTAALDAVVPVLFRTPPDVLIHAAVSVEGDRDALVRADYLGPAALIEAVAAAMRERGSGRIGVLVPQNARLGLAGLGDLSAPQAALWTWCEAKRDELERAPGRDVSLTLVIPPRTASATQRVVAARSGHSARLGPAEAGGLLRAVLAGRRRAGRRPILAALAMAVR
jgi:short-subunit dehydrogenase